MRNFRLLRADEIECRISEIQKEGKCVSLLLYKTARTDAAMLDEKYGIGGWQNDYKIIDGKLFCGIGISTGEGWVWKWNVGTESNAEPEKGQASDAMKRAGFVLGIGTELYSAPQIKVFANKCNINEYGGKYRCYDNFTVGEIKYDTHEDICALTILCNGKPCFAWGEGKTSSPAPEPTQAPPEAKQPPQFKCVNCGAVIKPYMGADEKEVGVRKHVEGSKKKFGDIFCLECIKAMTDAQPD